MARRGLCPLAAEEKKVLGGQADRWWASRWWRAALWVAVLTWGVGAGVGEGQPWQIARAYPTDGYEQTGIRRLAWQAWLDASQRPHSGKNPAGARWPSAKVVLRMAHAEARDFDLTAATPKDPQLQQGLEKILKEYAWRHYSVALLDISVPEKPRYAAVDELREQTPGSVGKLLVAAALYEQLRARFPDAPQKRAELLRQTMVTADAWAIPDHHEIPLFLSDDLHRVTLRRVAVGDTFSLWEWLDHMLSASSNSAASMVWREATLMQLLGAAYPPPQYGPRLFSSWKKSELTRAAFAVMEAPLQEAGIGDPPFVVRSFFTGYANRFINAAPSRTSPLALLRFMVRLEQGRVVDNFSSLDIKKMLYLTRPRIRYMQAKQLKEAAVFGKTGSLYSCRARHPCPEYEGDSINVLNAVVEVEQENSQAPLTPPRVYLVAVMSNELKRNAAFDHMILAGRVHRLVLAP